MNLLMEYVRMDSFGGKWLMKDGIREIWNWFFVFLNKDFSKEFICVFN